MSRKDDCTVYTLTGFLNGRRGQFRIIMLARSREDAMALIPGDWRTSRETRDWLAFDEHTAIGDLFATPYGTTTYEAVDADDVEA